MTKQTYLRRLRKALRGVPSRERESCIDYYAELIDDAFERGKTAREVFNELEAPEEAAEKLKGELSNRPYDYDDRDYFDDDRDYRRDRDYRDDYDDYDDRRRGYDRDSRDRERELDRRERERELDRRERELDRREHDRRERELDRRERELERREYETDRRDRDYDRDDGKGSNKPPFAARLIGVLIGLPLGICVLSLIVSLFITALSLVISGVYIVVFSIGLMFSSFETGLIQLGMGIATLALGSLAFILLSPVARLLWGITGWIFRGFCKSDKPKKERKAFRFASFAAWLAVFAVGSVLFVAVYGSVGFDYRRLAVTGDIETLEWTLEDEYDELKLDLSNFALHVESGEVEKPVFAYRQIKENPKEFAFEDGVVSISYEKSRNSWLSDQRNRWKRGIFFNAIEPELNGVTLTLPSEYAGNFEAKSDNGAVSLEGLTLKDVKLNLDNGAMKVSTCAFGSLSVTVDNGAVAIEDLTADTVTIETDNGAIKLTDIETDVLDLKSENGAVMVECATAERVIVEARNGYIGVKRVDAQELSLTGRNGMIKGELAGSIEDYGIDAQTQNGSCNLSNRTGGERTLYVRTRNGAINISFYGN